MRKVQILSIPGPDEPDEAAQEMGQMIDNDSGEPFGTTPLADEMLGRDPRERFEYYYRGWSNGYVQTEAAA